jgi:Rps23 Pro-64 3,4-dihydroxylase Tpa1-like proline 4-hydroxylase
MTRAFKEGGTNKAMVDMATLNSQVAHREYTAILYLNPTDWCPQRDGGTLRIFTGCADEDNEGTSAESTEEVVPVGGRLVVFDSRMIVHEVLPATRTRLAMTAWMLNENSVMGQRTAVRLKEE